MCLFKKKKTTTCSAHCWEPHTCTGPVSRFDPPVCKGRRIPCVPGQWVFQVRFMLQKKRTVTPHTVVKFCGNPTLWLAFPLTDDPITGTVWQRSPLACTSRWWRAAHQWLRKWLSLRALSLSPHAGIFSQFYWLRFYSVSGKYSFCYRIDCWDCIFSRRLSFHGS